jgi:hypothetical protein
MLLWTNSLADADPRRATLLRQHEEHTMTGHPGSPPSWPHDLTIKPPPFLHETDDALERAELLGLFAQHYGFCELLPGLGLLCSMQPDSTHWSRAFRVLASFPFSPARAREEIALHKGGIVAIKTRGGVLNTDQMQMDLRGSGTRDLVLFVFRHGDGPLQGVLTERC